jgi:hypothetical protein
MDAGGFTLVSMVKDALINELAKDKGWAPSEDDVQRLASYYLAASPNMAVALKSHLISMDDVRDMARIQLAETSIGTDGAKADQSALDAFYQSNSAKMFNIPETDTVKSLQAPDEASAMQAIEALKRSGDFAKVATDILMAPPEMARNAGRETPLPVTPQLPPDLKNALAALKPGEITPKPIALHPSASTAGAPATVYAVIQLVSREPARTLSLADVRPFIEQKVVTTSHPDWQQHQLQLLAAFTKDLIQKGELQINLKQYQPLVDSFIVPMAEGRMNQSPAPVLSGRPNGAPPPGSAPSGSSPQGSAGGAGSPGASAPGGAGAPAGGAR